ncbi:hypothetical protein NPX79_02025 [Spiroplasma endosymbiont of Anurida maritima]|uniref:hypothetical protein n=1 Tax=Spiroplasma endosymbiont of Anurida maritima TaxID=2967972 RepID=UPI0036D254E3
MLYYNKLASIRFIDYFTITILPFIGLAFIFAQLLVFSRIVINKEQISVKNFKRLYIIAVVVLALSLSLFFISQFNLYRINNIWNRQTEFFRNNIIKKLFGQSAIAPLWISEIKAIAVLIISFLSIGTFGAMGLSKILKEEFKEINQKYTYQINQKVIGWLED